jgi:putative cardiolipin synthase
MDTSANHPALTHARALVASFCIAVLSACSSLPDNASRVASHSLPADGTALAAEFQPLLLQHDGKSGFRLLIEGEEAFAARLQLIRAADSSLDVQYYIWHDDLTGRVTHHQLLAAADRGVRVRLLLDDLDTAGKDQLLRRIDAHPNVEIRLFNPFANRTYRAGDFVGDTRRVNRRMHNKTLTADGIATIFGGRNIGDEYFGATSEVAFGDMDALGVGPIAAEVSSQFDLYWNSPYSYPIVAFDWDEPVTEAEVAAFRQENNAFVAEAADSKYADILRRLEISGMERISQLHFVWSDWHLGFDQPRAIEMDEINEDTHLAAKIVKAMERAEEDLIIVSPYFVPGEKFTAYLVGLVERGVRVRILTNSLQANDVSLVHAGYMRYREDLVRGGVELYEYRATSNKIRRQMKREKIDVEKTSLHAKMFTIDEVWMFVGSFNLDGRSARLNTELGAYFASPVEASQFADNFDGLMRQLAYRIELDERENLRWVGYDGAEELVLDKEPDTGWWKRSSTRMLSWFVPESQL